MADSRNFIIATHYHLFSGSQVTAISKFKSAAILNNLIFENAIDIFCKVLFVRTHYIKVC
jgi:hypothetical protein